MDRMQKKLIGLVIWAIILSIFVYAINDRFIKFLKVWVPYITSDGTPEE